MQFLIEQVIPLTVSATVGALIAICAMAVLIAGSDRDL